MGYYDNEDCNQLITGIASSINGLILNKDLGVAFYNALRNIGESLSAGSCHIFCNNDKFKCPTTMAQYNWYAIDVPYSKDFSAQIGHDRNREKINTLKASRIFEVKYSGSTRKIKKAIGKYGIKSLIAFPIFVYEDFWGFLEVNDYHNERDWSHTEKNILQTTTTSIGGALERRMLEENLEQQVQERAQELLKNETYLNLAIESFDLGMWIYDVEAKTVKFNIRQAEIYELDDLGEPDDNGFYQVDDTNMFFEKWHPDHEKMTDEEFEDIANQNLPYDTERRLITGNGGIKYIMSKGCGFLDEEVPKIIGLTFDISKQKNIEWALKESEEKFKGLYNRTPAMLHSIDGQGYLVSVSDYWLETMGYTREEVIGTKSIDYMSRESRDFALTEALPEFFKKGYAYNIPYQLVKSNGQKINVLLSAISQSDAEGNFVNSFAVVTDITERVRTEKELKSSHAKFENLIKNVPGMVYTAHYPSLKMKFVSDYCKEITGYSKNQLCDGRRRLYSSLIHKDDIEGRNQVIQECLDLRKPFRVQYRLTIKKKKVKWVSEFGSGIYDRNNELTEVVGSIFDITDRVKTEERILSAVMQASDRERSRISTEIHSSLQQTLTVAALNFEYVSKNQNSLSKKSREKHSTGLTYLKRALEQTRSIAHRLMPKNIEDFGFIEVVHDLVLELNQTTNIKFTFLTNVSGFCLTVMTEATLYKIVQEAVNNAIKHSNAGHVTIQFILHTEYAHLSIEDDGDGFDLTDTDKHISSFGIASMKNRVTALHGSFQIDSHPGNGTSIIIEIPIEN